MGLAAAATILYGLATIALGLIGCLGPRDITSLIVGALAGVGLLACGAGLGKGKLPAGFVACGIAMLQGLFFGYRFIASGAFIPGGAMLAISFTALFFILIGMFLSIKR